MQILIEVIVGVSLAIGFILLARRSGSFSKERRIFAVGLVVVALVYVGFGLFSDSVRWKTIELIGVPIYSLFAWLGLKKIGLVFGGWLGPSRVLGRGFARSFNPIRATLVYHRLSRI